MTVAAERAARGAALLDRARPGWAASLDARKLDVADPRRCLLGRVYGSFGDAAAAPGLTGKVDGWGITRLADHGFAATEDCWWDELRDAWQAEIEGRSR